MPGRRRLGRACEVRSVDSVPHVGQLVFSLAGRDRGRALIVVGISDARHVLVCDGVLRPAARPKRKNIRHLSAAASVQEQIAAGGRPVDHEMRAWLAAVARSEEDQR